MRTYGPYDAIRAKPYLGGAPAIERPQSASPLDIGHSLLDIGYSNRTLPCLCQHQTPVLISIQGFLPNIATFFIVSHRATYLCLCVKREEMMY